MKRSPASARPRPLVPKTSTDVSASETPGAAATSASRGPASALPPPSMPRIAPAASSRSASPRESPPARGTGAAKALAAVFLPAACLVLAAWLAPRPALAASPRLQVFFAADFNDVPYQQAVYKKVAASWRWPEKAPKPGSKAVVIVIIRKDGTASQPALHMKSGSEAWDSAALDAVRRASPFEPLPKSYRPPSVEVHFHFGYE